MAFAELRRNFTMLKNGQMIQNIMYKSTYTNVVHLQLKVLTHSDHILTLGAKGLLPICLLNWCLPLHSIAFWQLLGDSLSKHTKVPIFLDPCMHLFLLQHLYLHKSNKLIKWRTQQCVIITEFYSHNFHKKIVKSTCCLLTEKIFR